jgi:hypothetical protein
MADVAEWRDATVRMGAGEEGQRAEAKLAFIGKVLGLSRPAQAHDLELLAQDTAVIAAPTEVMPNADIPRNYLATVVEQRVRHDKLAALENATPANSRLIGDRVTPASSSGGALTPIDRFVLADQVVAANAVASQEQTREGNRLGAATAENWADRGSLHLLDAANEIKGDPEMIRQAEQRGLMPQIDALVAAARQGVDSARQTPAAQGQ